VATQPGGTSQFCAVANGSGTVGTSNVANITVTCKDVAHFAYVANGDNTISAYSVDAVTGAPASAGPPQVIGGATSVIAQLATDPAGQYVFSLDAAHKQLLSSTINRSSGVLTAADAATLTGGPEALAVSPKGNFVYVASGSVTGAPNSGVLTTFAVLANGKLSFLGSTAMTQLSLTSMTIDPSGKHLYVGVGSTNVNVYALDPVSGLATFQTITGGSSGTHAITLSPAGFAYAVAVDSGVATIDTYPILPDGTFGGVLGRTTTGTGSGSISMDGAARFVYVPNFTENRISVFKADPKTGALSAGKDFTGFTGAVVPRSVAADPTGRFVYSVNFDNSLSAFSIDGATGTLTQVGANVSGSSAPSAQPFSMVLTK
jgi:6-phosphogluconolactonase (cycloisomerase 2 family)